MRLDRWTDGGRQRTRVQRTVLRFNARLRRNFWRLATFVLAGGILVMIMHWS